MIRLRAYTPVSDELSHSSQHETFESVHECLWHLLQMLCDDYVFCFAPEMGLEHRLKRDRKGAWRFADGTPFLLPGMHACLDRFEPQPELWGVVLDNNALLSSGCRTREEAEARASMASRALGRTCLAVRL